MLDLQPLGIAGLIEIRPKRFVDERGFFSEVWNAALWRKAGITTEFVQDNHSLSLSAGVLRGLHFQSPPAAQAKLVRVTHGSVFDVAVDLRRNSMTLGQWVGIVLSAAEWNQLLIPEGFAHGFLTLEPDTQVQYKTSMPYSPSYEQAIRFDDPTIGVDWPIIPGRLIVSSRDREAPLLANLETGF